MKRAFFGIAMTLGVLALGACVDPAARQAQLDSEDNQSCLELGFKPGTDAYGNCRLQLREIRARGGDHSGPNISFGVGLGGSF